jgi:enamine deaminase RidA (YjgF/YER057c/UK114 family)
MKRTNLAPSSIFRSDFFGFSQGVLVDEGKKTLLISGQFAADKKGNLLDSVDFAEQCTKALEGIDAVLKEAGATRHNIMKITAYVTDMQSNIQTFTELVKRYFGGDYPASTLIEVKGLAFPKQLVEIEALAVI